MVNYIDIEAMSMMLHKDYPNININEINGSLRCALIFYQMAYNTIRNSRVNSQYKEYPSYHLHKFVDKLIKRHLENDKETEDILSCKKGCSYCCQIPVCISKDEAQLIIKIRYNSEVPSNLISILERQSHATTPTKWAELTTSLNPNDVKCIFLNNTTNECDIYEYRPLACRSHLVVSPNDNCDSLARSTNKIAIWRPLDLQCIASVLTMLGDCDHMPIKLLEVVKY